MLTSGSQSKSSVHKITSKGNLSTLNGFLSSYSNLYTIYLMVSSSQDLDRIGPMRLNLIKHHIETS